MWIFESALDQAAVRALYLANGAEVADVPGDADRNGVVNDLDASILGAHWLQGGMGWDDGDFNNDGVVNDRDAAILAAHWGEGGTGGPSVPEPGSLALLVGIALMGMVYLRRRKA